MHSDHGDFASEWPLLGPRVERFLISRGVPPGERDDFVQETAARLFEGWDRLDHSKDVAPLAFTIALNLVRDNARKKREYISEIPDAEARSDVEAESLARLELRRVGRAMKHLPSDQRIVLLDSVLGEGHAPIDRSRNAVKMLRMRARRRLVTMLEAASAWVSLSSARFRRWNNDTTHPIGFAAVAAAAALVVGPGVNVGQVRPGLTLGSPHSVQVTPDQRSIAGADDSRSTRSSVSSRPTVALVEVSGGRVGTRDSSSLRLRAGGEVVEGSVEVTVQDLSLVVGNEEGPLPACVRGAPGLPAQAECPSPDESSNG